MKFQKWFLRIVNLFSIALIVCSMGVLLTVVMTKGGRAPSIFGYSLFRVMTGSMEPTIPVDSMIVVKRVDPSMLGEGDVISFYSSDPSLMGAVNTHRIVGIETQNDACLFRTKGDANNVEDRYNVQPDAVIGKVVFSSYDLGRVVRLISNPLIFIPLIIIPLVIMFGHSVYESVSLAKQIAREEEEAAVREAIEAIRQKKNQ